MSSAKWVWFFLLESFVVFSGLAATTAVQPTAKVAPKHYVGECFGGGVVFYVNKSPTAPVGQRGLIVAPIDVKGSFPWDTKVNSIDLPLTQPALFTGCTNTSETIKQVGASRAQAMAAAQAYTEGTYHDWSLPSQMELSTLYFQAAASGPEFWTNCKATPLSGATYWTSTQSNPSSAWGVSFAGGVVVIANKNSPLLVRAVRVF